MASVAALMLRIGCSSHADKNCGFTRGVHRSFASQGPQGLRFSGSRSFILINYIQATQRLRQEPAGSRGEASPFQVSQQPPPPIPARHFTVTRYVSWHAVQEPLI